MTGFFRVLARAVVYRLARIVHSPRRPVRQVYLELILSRSIVW